MKPILFNTEMVKAILDGKKTVMRRVLAEKERLDKKHGLDREPYKFRTGEWCVDKQTDVDDYRTCVLKPRYQPGDVLYVRETWNKVKLESESEWHYEYRASCENPSYFSNGFMAEWRPSIHMPKEAARIFLRVIDVRVERLQDITYEGCKAEGFDGAFFTDDTEGLPAIAIRRFSRSWDSAIKTDDREYVGWEANPWVWVIEFERISREEAEKEEND